MEWSCEGDPAGRRSIFQQPQCLIDTDDGGKLYVVNDVVNQLKTIEKPLVVISIAGLYRTGKSYLMNRLAGRTNGK